MLHAKPHRNGDTPETFTNTGLELMNLARKAQRQLATVRAEIMHGRNYQHQTAPFARDLDLASVNDLLAQAIRMEQLGLDIAKEGVE